MAAGGKSGGRHGDGRRRRPLRAGRLLPGAAAAACRRHGFAQARLVTDWAAVVGNDLAAVCQPERLARDGVLSLRVAPAFALQLQHLEPQLLERIATFFGHRAVRRLRLRQGRIHRRQPAPPARPRPLAAAQARWLDGRLAAIGHDGLRQALMRLGCAVLGAAPPPQAPNPSTAGPGERPEQRA